MKIIPSKHRLKRLEINSDKANLPIGFRISPIKDAKAILDPIDAYYLFMQGYDEDIRTWVKEYQTLVLNKDDLPIYKISFETSGNIKKEEIKTLFSILKGLPNISKVVVGRNEPNKPVTPDANELRSANELQIAGQKFGIPVQTQMIISEHSLYTFEPSDILGVAKKSDQLVHSH